MLRPFHVTAYIYKYTLFSQYKAFSNFNVNSRNLSLCTLVPFIHGQREPI